MKSSTLALGALLALVGCTALGPRYEERPVDDVLAKASVTEDMRPDALPAVAATPSARVDDWWGHFGDDALTRLIAKAYEANRTLSAARANLAAAKAAWRYQRGALWPSVDLGAGLDRQRTSENGLSGRRRYTDYNLAGSASWEIDFFGRQQFLTDAAEAQAQASEADLKAMWVSVSSELATAYLELRTLQGRLMVAEDNLRIQQDNYDLLADRERGGLTSGLQKYQAEYDLRNTAASIPSLKAQIVSAENAIAILCGVTPGTLPPEVVTPPRTDAPSEDSAKPKGLRPSGIPQADAILLQGGIPADAIRRRPDVIAAERLLKASVDTLGSAEAERYPTVTISGTIGLDSLKFGDLFDWDSHFYNFGPGITLPIFRGGQIMANIEIKTEQQKAALADYENTVLTALGDIRTALSGYVQEQERLGQLRRGVQAAQTAYEIAYNAYTGGTGDFFDVLDAQRQLQALDESRVISEGAIAQNQVALYKALCGGWDGPETSETAQTLFGKQQESQAEPLLAPLAAEEASVPSPAQQ